MSIGAWRALLMTICLLCTAFNAVSLFSADASFVTLVLHDGDGHYGNVTENDAAIVSLRTWHRTLDLHGVDTRLAGEFAYPMIARGRLLGALLLGPKRSQET
jgi:hypothetical protein